MKKMRVILMLGCVLVCSACGTAQETASETGRKTTEVVMETDDVTTEKEVNENQTVEKVDYSAYTKDYPVENRTNHYYWNIDTSGFDKNMFDGSFSVFGYDFNGKVTGSTLQANGFEIESEGYIKSLFWDKEENCFWDLSAGTEIYRDGNVVGEVTMMNYNNESDFYSDSSEMECYNCQTDETFADAIIPKCLVTDNSSTLYESLSIDDVIEKLGVPTYVAGRTNSDDDDLSYVKYVYVYDDYVLNFTFMYTEVTGIVNTGYTYEGRTIFEQPCSYYNADTDEVTEYNSPFEYLEKEQAEYLDSIG